MNAPLNPPRRTFLAVSCIALVFLFGQGGLNLVSIYGRTTHTTSSVITPTGGQVKIGSDSGDVAVAPSTDSLIHITTRARYGLRRPALEQRADASGIELEADCLWADSQCDVDYDVTIPAGLAVVVSTGSGDISISDVSGAAQLSTGSGDISVRRVRGPALDVRTGSGNIDLVATESERTVARTGSGDIVAEFSAPPGDVQARTGSGDVTLALPEAAYAVDVNTGSGDRTVEVINDPGSPRTVVARTGSGDVRVVPAG